MFPLPISFTNVVLLAYYFSISLRLGSHNETNSLQDSYHSTETLCPRSPVHTILFDVLPTQTFWMRNIFTMSLLLMLSVSKNTTRLKNSMWNVYDKSLKISFWSWVLRLLLDVWIRVYQMFSKVQHYWIFFNDQSSRKLWSGLRLVSFLHQRVISKVAILFNIS